MARNEEKHAGRLNRLWLQQLDDERLKKNPLRPGLGSLRTAAEVKKWIPSIKDDIDFYLKQSQVGCFPERKISEFASKIESLTKEYKAYLRKYRQLEGNTAEVPWTDKPYTRKHKLSEEASKVSQEISEEVDMIPAKKFSPLSVPILEYEDSYKDLYGYDTMHNATLSLNSTQTVDTPLNNKKEILGALRQIEENNDDQPLEFNTMKMDEYRCLKGTKDAGISSDSFNESECNCTCMQTVTMETPSSSCKYCENVLKEPADGIQAQIAEESYKITEKVHVGNSVNQNILGLPYSDSSGDEEEG